MADREEARQCFQGNKSQEYMLDFDRADWMDKKNRQDMSILQDLEGKGQKEWHRNGRERQLNR